MTGLVLVDITNLIDYSPVLRQQSGTILAWPSFMEPYEQLVRTAEAKKLQLRNEIDNDEYLAKDFFGGKKAWPAIVLYAQAATAVESPIVGVIPTLLPFLGVMLFGEIGGAMHTLERLNKSLQDKNFAR